MSTPMEETFFSSDMDSYTINHYAEPSYNNANMNNNNNSLDPRLLSSPQNTAIMSNESPHEHYPQPHLLSPSYNFNIPPQQQQFYDPASDLSLQNYEPMRHQMLGHRRSVSVPPEDLMLETVQQAAPLAPAMVFYRGGTPLGDSMGGGKAGGGDGVVGGGGKKFLKKAAAAQKRQMQRHVPYPSPGIDRMGGVRRVQYAMQNPGPTSAPQQQLHHQQQQQQQMAYLREEDVAGVMQEFHGSTPSPQSGGFDNAISPGHRSSPAQMPMELADIDALAFGSRSDVDTAVLGMLGFTERLSRDCEAMRQFLARGFKSNEEDEVERVRQEKRALNHKVSTLEDGLEMLPLPEGKGEEEINVPVTGQEVRELDVEKTDELLEVYGIAYTADTFLHEKKMAYLRFVGVSRALMHLVLD
ncbi:hypothetical protein D6C78_01520 [Aureobasidium pullulans]|uniref:Uncharacterized protein n=1 Tax=Aureobasidium pullulans TaxID=5580 RepID=A0A4T0C368_AURPU|nr:hypothetical protein D6C78_01520 [Aureobasidium pullulans]